ncbi:MAG: type IV pilus modification PilV family protein [bacterium]
MKPRDRQFAGSPNRRRHRGGFTLIEAALTTVIVGTGVLAIVAAQQAYHQQNDWAQHTGTAQYLANELREMTLDLHMHDPISGKNNLGPEPDELNVEDYDDLDDFAGSVNGSGEGTGTTFNPPINALGQEIPNMDNWQQFITVENVLSDNISSTVAQPMGTTNMMRLTVQVQYKDPNLDDATYQTITELTWVVAR